MFHWPSIHHPVCLYVQCVHPIIFNWPHHTSWIISDTSDLCWLDSIPPNLITELTRIQIPGSNSQPFQKKKKKWNQTTMNIHHTPKLCVVHVSKCFPTSPWCLNSHSHSISLPRGIIPCVLKGRQEYRSWETVSQNHCCWVKVPKLCLWSRKGWKADQKCRMDQVWGVEIEVPVRVIWRQKV